MFLLVSIVVLSVVAVGWHVWLTRRMSFSSFEEDEGEAKRRFQARLRLLLPLVILGILAGILPALFVIFSPELEDALSDPTCTQFVRFPWSWLLPARGFDIAIASSGALSVLLYWTLGTLLWIANRR